MGDVDEFARKVRVYGLERYKRYYGRYAGIVKDVDDPDGRARIRVRVPFLQVEGSDPLPSWALPKGGRFNRNEGRGEVFVPEPEDQVWVEFQDGDPGQPLYTPGGFFADGELPDEFDPPDDRGWKTRSGHVVRFREGDGEEEVLVRHKGGGELVLDSDDRIRMETKKGDVLEMDPNGSILVEKFTGPKVELSESRVEVTDAKGETLELSPGESKLSASAQVVVEAPRVLVAGGTSIELGRGAVSPLVKGDVLAAWLGSFFGWVTAHVHAPHVPPTASVPSAPPLVPPPPPPGPALLSTRSRTI